MRLRNLCHGRGVGLLWGPAFAFAWAAAAMAQYPAPPSTATPPPQPPRVAAAPAPAAKKKAAERKGDTKSYEEDMEKRLKQLEDTNKQLLRQLQTLSRQNAEISRRLGIQPTPGVSPGVLTSPGGGSADSIGTPFRDFEGGTIGNRGGGPGAAAGTDDGTGVSNMAAEGGGAGPFSSTPEGEGTPFGPGSEGTIGNRPDREAERRRVRVDFGDGLEFTSTDDEFQLKFHDLTQAEVRMFDHTGTNLHDNFFVPRQRWYFLGRVSKNIEFYTVINRGYGSLDLLDGFIDLIANEHFQLRAGRMKTPYSYEYWKVSEGDLIAPERSLFIGNFAPNREVGMMGHGRFFDQRLEYAIGVFNGPRRSFQDFNDAKDLFVFLNTKPFLKWENYKFLNQLNITGSFNMGNENNPLQPNALRTANDQTPSQAADNLSPTFFKFNNNVFEYGWREQWSVDLTWYYKSFNILTGYQAGFQDYAITGATTKTRVPLQGFEITLFDFITGEQITRRVNVVEPLRPFGFKDGRLQPGAIELYTRFSFLNVGRNVFTAGLADPNLWTNQAYTFDTGINWYLNHYMKVYLDWQHSEFGNAVSLGPGRFSRTMNLYWLRFQLFF